jgi:hypothetical protein
MPIARRRILNLCGHHGTDITTICQSLIGGGTPDRHDR